MNAITPLAFHDQLVRTVSIDGDLWFHAADVCRVLGLSNPSMAVAGMGLDEVRTLSTAEGSPGPDANFLSEAGVYRLVFRSRKPIAEQFKRWLAHEVIPAIRKTGQYRAPGTPPDAARDAQGTVFEITAEALPVITTKLQLIREARHLFGHERARALWQQLGLAVAPQNIIGGKDEAFDCLQTILAGSCMGSTMRLMLQAAMDDDQGVLDALKPHGIWAKPDEDGFVVANRNKHLERLLEGTAWARASWQPLLRRLPGAIRTQVMRFEPNPATPVRGVFLPSTVLDSAAAA